MYSLTSATRKKMSDKPEIEVKEAAGITGATLAASVNGLYITHHYFDYPSNPEKCREHFIKHVLPDHSNQEDKQPL